MAETNEACESTMIEGDEEVQYVYVTLPKDADAASFGPGTIVQFQGLATDRPVLCSQQGDSVMLGTYQDTIGSVLLIKEQPGPAFNSKPIYSCIGHTDKQLNMVKSD